MTNNLQGKDKEKEEEKQFRKLLDSYVAVAKHKLGRQPTLEELSKMLDGDSKLSKEDPGLIGPVVSPGPVGLGGVVEPVGTIGLAGMAESADALPPTRAGDVVVKSDAVDVKPGEPKILGVRIYYGMTNGKPDPNKILYYEDPTNNKWFCCESQEWEDKRPEIIENFHSRPITASERDIVAAIANGVMEDEDYAALSNKGMIGPLAKRLWELSKRAFFLADELEKAKEAKGRELMAEDDLPEDDVANRPNDELDDIDDSPYVSSEYRPDDDVVAPILADEDEEDVVAPILEDEEGEKKGEKGETGEDWSTGTLGQNVLREIVDAAATVVAGEGMTDRIREVVREELRALGLELTEEPMVIEQELPEPVESIEPIEQTKPTGTVSG